MNEILHVSGCSEKYAELCALSTSGDLNADEIEELKEHLARCSTCAALLGEYTNLTQVGMARLAAELGSLEEGMYPFHAELAEQRLKEALCRESDPYRVASGPGVSMGVPELRASASSKFGKRIAVGIGLAAAILLAAASGVEFGRQLESRAAPTQMATTMPAPLSRSPQTLSSQERDALQARLTSVESTLSTVENHAAEADKHVVELTSSRASLLAQIDQLTKSGQATSDSLAAATQQRNGLEQQLSEANKTLDQVKADLVQARLDRQGAVLKAASLEQEVNDLHATLASTDRTVSTDEQFLAKDRDIRELMGARQLYIADVLDVQNDGERSKPFGRVFYTKGKSLIFYAFDLQSQPGYHEAKTFQAWGRPDGGSSKPLSLGIFYMDSEQNKRWVVKSASADVLARINAVFVTVEPKGGSQEPTSKPFLEAYLHSLPPNHP
jgi:hypothetical protein